MSERDVLHDVTTPDAMDELMSEGGGSVVLDFWSTTCGPCLAMAPDFKAVAAAHADAPVKFCKVQTDAHPELAAAFRIRSVPTILFVHDGEILDAVVGRMDAARLDKKVRWLLAKARGDGFFRRMFSG